MLVTLELDPAFPEPQAVIRTAAITQEVQAAAELLGRPQLRLLPLFAGDTVQMREAGEILRFYAEGQKVMAQTAEGSFAVRLRLYELEQQLDKTLFVRISHGEIVNLKKIRQIDLSLAGTICIRLENGDAAYASRRYVARIKQILGL